MPLLREVLRALAEGRVAWGFWPPGTEKADSDGLGIWISGTDVVGSDEEIDPEGDSKESGGEDEDEESEDEESEDEDDEEEEGEDEDRQNVGIGRFGALAIDTEEESEGPEE